MSSKTGKYTFAKKELLKIVAAIVVLAMVSAVYYFHIRKESLRIAEKRANSTLKNTEMMISIRGVLLFQRPSPISAALFGHLHPS